MDKEDLQKLVKELDKRIPSLEDAISDAVNGKYIERYYIPLARIDDVMIDIRAMIRNRSNLKPAFKNVIKKAMETKMLYLRYLRMITDPSTTAGYIDELIAEMKGE
jgi:hypothetical protein